MATLRVDTLRFHFHPNTAASKFDEWNHYRSRLQPSPRDAKAVDIVAAAITRLQPPYCWLIEVKDFRVRRGAPGAKNCAALPEEVIRKALDTISGLKDAASGATTTSEKDFAQLAVRANQARIVLHMETAHGKNRLFPEVPTPANVLQKLRQLAKNVDPNPLVLSKRTTARAKVPWKVT